MKLSQIIEGLGAVRLAGPAPETVQVGSVSADSRAVAPGTLFVAVRGARHDGHAFLAEAAAAGAAAALVEAPPAVLPPELPVWQVPSSRRALGLACARIQGSPAEALELVGVTGTNGKTTVTHLVEAVARAAGRPTGRIGTLGAAVGGGCEPLAHTTPGPEVLHPLLAKARAAGLEAVVMEVSSHALAQDRVAGLSFDVAAFTHLSRDHLDYHRTLEDYYQAKRRLFFEHLRQNGTAVVHIAGDYGRRLARELSEAGRTVVAVTAAPDGGPRVAGVRHTVRAEAVHLRLSGTRAVLHLAGGPVELASPLVGAFNLENLILAAAVAEALGVPPEAVAEAFRHVPGPPGRLERVSDPAGRFVFVDYAHTDDALRRVIQTLRALTPADRRIVVVFGCGGDRDRGKRPLMGRAAAAADHVVVTSDNPRSEAPEAIIEEILPGLAGASHTVEPDRAAAIADAVGLARPGDVVLLAGKGHEAVQIVGEEAHPFDDRVVAAEALRRVSPGTQVWGRGGGAQAASGRTGPGTQGASAEAASRPQAAAARPSPAPGSAVEEEAGAPGAAGDRATGPSEGGRRRG